MFKAPLDPAILSRFPKDLVENFMSTMDPDYFAEFNQMEIENHLSLIVSLGQDSLCATRAHISNDTATIEIAGSDLRGSFAVIVGTLSALGLNIQSGLTFTSIPGTQDPPPRPYPCFVNRFSCLTVDLIDRTTPLEEQIHRELSPLMTLLANHRYDELKKKLNDRIRLFLERIPREPRLYPISISFETDKNYTVMHVTGQSTPAFLFGLANALWMKGMVFRKMRVDTKDNQVNDIFYLQDRRGRPIDNAEQLDNLRIAVVLIKHFTLFLPMASDPDLALRKFDQFLDQVVRGKLKPQDLVRWEQSKILATMAKAFGTGDYLWEEFIKFQSEAFLPILRQLDEIKSARSKTVIESELLDQLGGEPSFESKFKKLNEFKDSELFRIDLLYLVYPNKTFLQFSQELTDLAETVINTATHLIRTRLSDSYGMPMNRSGTPCLFAVLALGKFGSRELGYASDLELAVIYEDNGHTSKPGNSISNAEFFNHFVKSMTQNIRVKKAGIFEIDWRLRPHGEDGPLSCSLDSWKKYYAGDGQAHDFERQALIKLRPVYGNYRFIREVFEARDVLIYGKQKILPDKTLTLREKQLKELVGSGRVNVKYSPGGLCEIEYGIQFLQLEHGAAHPRLRTPNTIEAMEVLLELGLLSPTEFEKLYFCEAFLRRLINALRLVRGHAKDLLLPEENTDEFQFLSRRMGYDPAGGSSPQFQDDIHAVFHTVHDFFHSRFIKFSGAPQFEPGLQEILSGSPPAPELVEKVLAHWQFQDTAAAYQTLRKIAHRIQNPVLYSVLVMASRIIRKTPSPDKCLIQMEKFFMNQHAAPNLLQQMLYHPRYIDIAVTLLGYGEFLSNILIQDPYFLYYISGHSSLSSEKSRAITEKEIESIDRKRAFHQFLDDLRIYNHRELLRIGVRDIYLKKSLGSVVRELSNLADAVIYSVFLRTARELKCEDLLENQCLIAMGKLGGGELNYSSDVDLIFVRENGLDGRAAERLDLWNQLCLKHLAETTTHGKLFRVDINLRPYGTQGQLTGTLDHYKNYYRNAADPWELQAWLKGRAVCGNRALGIALIEYVQQHLLKKMDAEKALINMRSVRAKTLALLSPGELQWDVKQGPGGIRTIEFYVQHLQWTRGAQHPEILSGHTMQALVRLLKAGLLREHEFQTLMEAYVFYRRIEHAIQFESMQQRHLIPADPEKRDQLAKRMGLENRLGESAGQQLTAKYLKTAEKILDYSRRLFPDDQIKINRGHKSF